MAKEVSIRDFALFTLGTAMTVIPVLAQTPVVPKKPAFEVVSIKTSSSESVWIPATITGRRFVANLATLKSLVQFCYRPVDGRILRSGDIIGGPDWVGSEAFDIQAKSEGGVAGTAESMRLMVQSFLAERFELKVHWESREIDVYQMIVGKNGPRIKSSSEQTPHSPAPPRAFAFPILQCQIQQFERGL